MGRCGLVTSFTVSSWRPLRGCSAGYGPEGDTWEQEKGNLEDNDAFKTYKRQKKKAAKQKSETRYAMRLCCFLLITRISRRHSSKAEARATSKRPRDESADNKEPRSAFMCTFAPVHSSTGCVQREEEATGAE